MSNFTRISGKNEQDELTVFRSSACIGRSCKAPVGVEIPPGGCLQGQLSLAGITGMRYQCFHQALELFSSRTAGNWGEFCSDATWETGCVWRWVGWTRDGAEGREELDLEMPIGVLAQGLEPRSQGWWHQLSGILKSFLCQVLGMDRADQSCLIASSRQQGRIHPSSPGFQLVGLNAGEKETGVWVGMCVMTPKWGVLREKQNEFIRKRRYNREKKIRIWEQKGKGWNIEKL